MAINVSVQYYGGFLPDIILLTLCYYKYHVCMYSRTYNKSMDQPGKVASPARGQLNREN